MKMRLITFADDNMSQSRALCVTSALRAGGVDDAGSYDQCVLRTAGLSGLSELYESHKQVFDAPRGCGYWAWKPAILYYCALQRPDLSNDGDILIYADAGIEFIAPVQPIISRMDQDIFLFGNNWEHAHWCKSDVVAAVWPTTDREFWKDDPMGWSRFGKQVQASVIFFRVSDYTRRFVQEWLAWCLTKVPADSQVGLSCGHWWKGNAWSRCPKCGDVAVENHSEYLIDDSPSRNRNHPEFREHRHDQAILTTMAYREGLRLHYWPAVYNRGGSPEFVYEKLPEYAGDDYPVLFHHHRRRNHEWK